MPPSISGTWTGRLNEGWPWPRAMRAFPGRPSKKELLATYPKFDVLVLPSLTTPDSVEQFGAVLAEAMAWGVPVIGSNSGGIPETIGQAGIIVPEGDVPALARALASLIRQEYPRLEVIVVDGGSTDGTVELLEQSPVVSRFVSEPDEGQTQALNKGFRLATGEIFGWLNCDERYRPGTLRLVGEAFAEQPDLDILFGHLVVTDKFGRELGCLRQPAIHPRNYALYAAGLLYSEATFWKKELHGKTGELAEVLCRRYAMDVDWFGRLSLAVKSWRRLDACLSEFIEHEGRMTAAVPELPDIEWKIRQRLLKLAGGSAVCSQATVTSRD